MAATMVDKASGRDEPGQSEAGLVGAGAGISDVRAGGRACRLCAGLDHVWRSRLPAGRGSHLRLPERHAGRARRRLLRFARHERGRTRRRPAAICARDRAGDRGTARLLRRDRCSGSARTRHRARARWVLANRALPGGGFRHAEQDKGGPYLADNVEMAKVLLALHRSTGEREWLAQAQATADFIARTFVDPATGGFVASAAPDAQATDETDQAARGQCHGGADVQPAVGLYRRRSATARSPRPAWAI